MTARSWMFERYGIYGLVPAEILIGVYLCSPASWLFGWQKWRSFAITMAGYAFLPRQLRNFIALIGSPTASGLVSGTDCLSDHPPLLNNWF